jgi:hypothetical protein
MAAEKVEMNVDRMASCERLVRSVFFNRSCGKKRLGSVHLSYHRHAMAILVSLKLSAFITPINFELAWRRIISFCAWTLSVVKLQMEEHAINFVSSWNDDPPVSKNVSNFSRIPKP